LKNGADPNRSGSQPCRTPLSLSAENTEILTTLVSQGARIDLSSGCSPILVDVARSGSPEAIDVLVRNGARVDQADNDGKTPLIVASGNNLPKREARVDNLRALLERGANPNLRDKDGSTALLYAVYSGSLEATRLLLAAKADPNLYDDDGFGPLMVATQLKERIDIMETLLGAGANPNARTLKAGLTPLHHSLRSSAPYCAKAILLLKAGADMQAIDNEGRRPLSNLPPKGVEFECDEIRTRGGPNSALQGTPANGRS
jgi:ankyrin repeat protein